MDERHDCFIVFPVNLVRERRVVELVCEVANG